MHTKPKKRLGQNFLVDGHVQRRIVENCAFSSDQCVLEIGAGRGEMTRRIAPLVKQLTAVEIDRDLSGRLAQEWDGHPGVEIVAGDILRFDLAAYFGRCGQKAKVVGNIPYYITTPIIERLIEFRDHIEAIYLLVQKEFAQRVVAGEGSKTFGSLSCFVQYFTQPQIMFSVSPRSFFPVPKVESCLLRLVPRPWPSPAADDPKWFFRVVRQAFSQRRKQMKNCLKGTVSPEVFDRFCAEHSLDARIRSEMVSLAQFVALSNMSRPG